MAQIILNIPDAVLPRVIASFSDVFNFAANALPGETSAQFAKRQLVKFATDVVKNSESRSSVANAKQTIETARQNALNLVDQDIVIT